MYTVFKLHTCHMYCYCQVPMKNNKIMSVIPWKKMESRKFGLFRDKLVCATQSMNKVCLCLCLCVCVCVCVYVCAYACKETNLSKRIFLSLSLSLSLYIYIYIYFYFFFIFFLLFHNI